jgi:hypothetical protein
LEELDCQISWGDLAGKWCGIRGRYLGARAGPLTIFPVGGEFEFYHGGHRARRGVGGVTLPGRVPIRLACGSLRASSQTMFRYKTAISEWAMRLREVEEAGPSPRLSHCQRRATGVLD